MNNLQKWIIVAAVVFIAISLFLLAWNSRWENCASTTNFYFDKWTKCIYEVEDIIRKH